MRVVELGRSDRRDYASTLSHIQAQDDTHAGTQTAITDGVTLTCDNDVINIIGATCHEHLDDVNGNRLCRLPNE